MKKSYVSLAIIIMLVAITLYLNFSNSNHSDVTSNVERIETKAEKGYLAPNFTIEHVDGNKITLANLKGKPVFINFWASWCPPCKEEMPFIQEAYNEYGDQIEFIMINVIETDTLEDMNAYLSENGYTFPVYLDKKNKVSDLYNVFAYPTSFFIDRNGKIEEFFLGGMDQAYFSQKIQQLLRN